MWYFCTVISKLVISNKILTLTSELIELNLLTREAQLTTNLDLSFIVFGFYKLK